MKIAGRSPAIAYFVHNTADAAVLRRVQTLSSAGVSVTLIGFRRSSEVPKVEGATVVDIGQTKDGRLMHRIGAVLIAMLRFQKIRGACAAADVIMARNLEMLLLGTQAAHGRRLVYECLDIHRTLLEDGTLAKCIQWVEAWLLRRVDMIITSSPRFASDYFRARRKTLVPVVLSENKVPSHLAPGPFSSSVHSKPNADSPWVIGWFGMLRCRRSLEMLAAIAAKSRGRIEILIAGIPSEAEFADFANQVKTMPGVRYAGPYRPSELVDLYNTVHFAWAIDYFEEGLNSSWLLPNRLYESLVHGVVPIALEAVETGHWLTTNAVGVVVKSPEDDIYDLIEALTPDTYAVLQGSVQSLARDKVIDSEDSQKALVNGILFR